MYYFSNLFLNCHLIVVKGSACYATRGLKSLVGFLTCQIKSSSGSLYEQSTIKDHNVVWNGITGAPSWVGGTQASACWPGPRPQDLAWPSLVCAYGLISSVEYPVYIGSLEVEGAPIGDSAVLLGDFNIYVVNNINICKSMTGRYGLPNLNPRGVLLLDFYASHGLNTRSVMLIK